MTYQDLTNVFQLADATWGADYHESFKVYEDNFYIIQVVVKFMKPVVLY